MKSTKFINIGQLYQTTSELKNLNQIFLHLEKLNQILKNYVPKHLGQLCHVGAFDHDKNMVVIYTETQEALYILKSMGDAILHNFQSNGISFDNILFKVNLATNSHHFKESITFKDEDEVFL